MRPNAAALPLTVSLTVSLAALIAASPAPAADVDSKSKIDAVTVYPDAAAVTRLAEIDLPSGAATLVFKALPINLDVASLRVEGEAGGRLGIGAVESRLTPADVTLPDTAANTRVKLLRENRAAAAARLAALEAKRGMMKRFSEMGPEKLVPEKTPVDVAQWNAAWEAVGAGLARVNEDIRLAGDEIAAFDEEIRALELARQRGVPRGQPTREVTVALEAGEALKGKVRLTYRVAGAGWRPLYDARLDTGAVTKKPVLELVRRAAVTQRTGEDWTDVALAVSTTRASRGTAAPDIQTVKLDFFEAAMAKPMATRAAPTPAAAGSVAQDEASETMKKRSEADAAATPLPQRQAEEAQASVEGGAYQASFQIPGRISIPTDGSQKSFRIASRSVSPTLSVKTSPSLEETAYLQASFINDEDAPLLAGDVAIHRDGAFAGIGHFALIAPGDSADLGFGADDRVKVTRVPVRRKENEPGWFGNTKTETRDFKTVIKNLHDFPVRIAVIDQIPITENTAIVIEQLPVTTAPTEKLVADKRGVMGWTFDYAPGEQKEIRLAYRMKWPGDRSVVFQTLPQGAR